MSFSIEYSQAAFESHVDTGADVGVCRPRRSFVHQSISWRYSVTYVPEGTAGLCTPPGGRVGHQSTRDKTVVGNDGVERVLTPGSYNGSTIDENGVVRTSQTLNVKLCKKEIAAGGIEPVGITVLHEVLESYFGGRSSPGQGFTKSAFLGAHGKALLVDTRAAGITAIVKNQSKGNRFTVTIEGTKVSWGGKYKTNNWPGRGNPFKDN